MWAMTPAVRQNAALSRFELDVDGGVAFVSYQLAPNEIIFMHTETPLQARERGVGTRLVLGALEAARAQGLKVRPLCGFVRFVIARHPEFQDLVA
jgi:predicted GNAT family acetyltransferase